MAKLPKAKVEKIQDMLNNIVKPRPPLKVDGIWGKNTTAVMKQLQYQANIKQTGEVDADTAIVVARVMKTGKIAKEQPAVYLNVNGKLVGYTQKQYDKIHKEIVNGLKTGPALAVRQQAGTAESLWNSFNRNNKDQWFVSWCIEATRGVDLPKKSLITNAMNASKKLDAYLNSGNLQKFHAEYPKAEQLTNHAALTMQNYQKSMISGGENWVTSLKFTKAASFTFVSVFAAPVAASALSTGALASAVVGNAAVAVTQSAAGEIGKFAADEKGWTASGAMSNVLVDGGVGAILGVFAKGGSGGKHIFEATVTKLGPKVAAETGFKLLSKDTIKRVSIYMLSEGGKSTLDGAVKDAGQAAKNDPKMTADKFASNLATNFAKGVALGPLGKVISSYGNGKLPKKFENKIWMQALKTVAKTSKKGQLNLGDVDKKTQEMVTKLIEDHAKKSIDVAVTHAFQAMKGQPNPATLEKKIEAEMFSDQRMKEYIAIATKHTEKSIKKKK